MEYEHLFLSMKEGMIEALEKISSLDKPKMDTVFEHIKGLSPYDYAQTVVFSFPSPRLDYYKNANFNSMQSSHLREMGEVEKELGYYPIDINLPLLHQMNQLNFAILFLGLVFSIILSLFVVISIILIYSIQLVNVEQESFKIRMKRVLGLSRISLGKDIILQTLVFSTPGVVVAYLWAFPLLRTIWFYGFELQLNLKLDPNPTAEALYYGLLLGLLIPVISSFIPIKTALSKKISEAIHPGYFELKETVVRICIEFAFISTVYGVWVYVVLPSSMLSLNLGRILAIFFLILIGLLYGWVLILSLIHISPKPQNPKTPDLPD